MAEPLPYHLSSSRVLIVRQVMAAMIQDRCFGSSLLPSSLFSGWSSSTVAAVLAAVPTHFFLSPRSIGRQSPASRRHRSPLKQRILRRSFDHRDFARVNLGVSKTLEFYSWLSTHCSFAHDELTCRELSLVLARANALKMLWQFLRCNKRLITTTTITCIIQVLGEEGSAKQALLLFYRMKQFLCKPDLISYNTVMSVLCNLGDLKNAKSMLYRMELPGTKCPPDLYTYTILISAYCKRSTQTGCRKAIRRRIWEANHLFKQMISKRIVPDVVTYNCLIDGLCKTYRISRAHELFEDMLARGLSPNRVTYNSFIRYYSATNEVDKAIEMMRAMVERKHGTPTTSSYTPLIHTLCETGRAKEAKEYLVELVDGGSVPREFTYKLVKERLVRVGEEAMHHDLCRKIEDGISKRFRQVMKVKAVMNASLKIQ